MSAWRASGSAAAIAASTIAFDEMLTYLGARKEEKRNDLWGWTAVVEERGGSSVNLLMLVFYAKLKLNTTHH